MQKTWGWNGEQRCCGSCPPGVSLVLEGGGVRYYGFCSDVGFGGGYTIGFQTAHEFLTHGPLDDEMPGSIVAQVRAALTAVKDRAASEPSPGGRADEQRQVQQ